MPARAARRRPGESLLVGRFILGAAVSLGVSWLLVVRLERIGARLGFSEALLGMLAAVAADAPEITTAVTALIEHHGRIGAGVAIGSNLFNLAALLGLAALVAGRLTLHRRVVAMDGTVAMWVATLGLLVVLGAVAPVLGLVIALALFVPYLFALSSTGRRLLAVRVPGHWVAWLEAAVAEAEVELEESIHPRAGGIRDAVEAVVATVVVVVASVVMEHAASSLGRQHHVPDIVIGGLVLAAVTSLPNAVAGIYLARRGRDAAALSTALNSNAINLMAGLLLSGALLGLGAPSGPGRLVAIWNVALTAVVIAGAYRWSGLSRRAGVFVIGAYLAFVVVLLAVS